MSNSSLNVSDVMEYIIEKQKKHPLTNNMFDLIKQVNSDDMDKIDIPEIKKTLLTPSKIGYLVSKEQSVLPDNDIKNFLNSEDLSWEKKNSTYFPKFDFSTFPEIKKLTEGVFCGEDENHLILIRFLDNTLEEFKNESEKYVIKNSCMDYFEGYVIALIQNNSYFLIYNIDEHIYIETNFLCFFDTRQTSIFDMIIQNTEGEFTPEKMFKEIMVPTALNSIFYSDY